MQVEGLIPFSSVDYPGHWAAVLFLSGCPWRCTYCHNRELQPFQNSRNKISLLGFLEFLKLRKGLLDGAVLSGGDPTSYPSLPLYLKMIKELGFKVGLHTAGMFPETLEKCLPLVDWIGFDIKAPLDNRYDLITQKPQSALPVLKSLEVLRNFRGDLELRHTWDTSVISHQDLLAMKTQLHTLGFETPKIQEMRNVEKELLPTQPVLMTPSSDSHS